jgi:hypothetical protein
MMDSVLLLGTGLLMAFVSWIVWSFFGSETPSVIAILLLVGVSADNYRLRRRLRDKEKR